MNDDGLRRDYFRLFGISKDEFERRLGKIGFGDCYKVKVMSDGLKVEFNSKGEWKEISRKSAPIDDRFVPQQIRKNVASRWPEARFRKIERYRQGYEVELSNGLELKYNKNFKLAEIDD